jgi:membrane protein DedA with SNARE-associated domain
VLLGASSWADSLVSALGGNLDPWGYVLVFLAAVTESAAFTGLIVPGETIMLLAGFLCWRGDMNLGVTMACAVSGAIIGDSIGYEIGRHLGSHILDSRIGRWVGRERWERARNYLRVKGGRAVFIGRFISILRALVPAVAGDARLPYRKFLAWNAAGGLIWGILHVGIGYVAGDSYRRVERQIGRASWILLGLVLVAGILLYVLRHRREEEMVDEVSQEEESHPS